LERIRDSMKAEISHIQVKTPADFEENFRQYAAAGYTLVIGHGFEFQDAAARVAPEYPKTFFVTTGGETVRPNLAALSFAFDEPSFLAGMAAAATSSTGTIACVGGTELPPVKSSLAG
jgi:basic membrane protein A